MSAPAPLHICNVEVALWRGEHWLLIRRGSGERHAADQLALVGGKVEHDDAAGSVLEDALRREIAEETGLKAECDFTYVASTRFTLEDGTSVVDVVFCAPCPEGRPAVQDSAEVAAITWLTAGQVALSDAPSWTKEYVARAETVRRSHPTVVPTTKTGDAGHARA
ncbi:NUDIX hydrolase [Streptomyces sp. NPDC059785]|uniref:NUDIX hydrolase n=1 Tax=Streptomyces sp. NPDC059785 TaxID=3346945 RepID=UPI00364DCA58